jgi:pterin-4a-carbinolamine dehydratase
MLIYMEFVVQAHIDDHTLSATTETVKEAFAKAIEWQVVHKLTRVTISDGVRSFSITDFASAMAFLDIANTVGATSDRRPKVQE